MSAVKHAEGGGPAKRRDASVAFRFGIPRLPIGHVRRPRLLSVLKRGEARPLTLVSAAAGTGKTSLVADWAGTRDPELTAWITFERGDGHASDFWSSVLAQLHLHGVRAAGTRLAPNALDVPRRLLAEVASSLSVRDEPLALVLDGWEFTTHDVAAGLDFLLRHSGHKLGCVIVTRSDPVLPLHSYRLNDLMTEVRTADLAFTHDELRALVDASGLALSEQSVAGLTTRTRGWVAGLRFAMMYLLGQPDPDAAVVQLAAGDIGNIAEYLVAEVLEMQSEAERELLLNTSIVDVLRPGLIEELGGPAAPRGIAMLAKGNALLETVADHPGWYRYHPFFGDMLRAELNYLAPARAIALHRRAARWFAANGMLDATVSHAAAAYQWAEAAQYVVDDLAVGLVLQGGEQEGLSSALRAMPQGVPGAAAAIVRAAVAASRGDTSAAQLELKQAQRESDDGDSNGGTSNRSDRRAQRLANGLIASVVSVNDPNPAVALQISTAAELERDGQRADRLAAHPELTAMIMAARATAMVRLGQIPAARSEFAAAAEVAEAPGCQSTLVYCLSELALLDAVDGALRRGTLRAERALGIVKSAGLDGCGLQVSSLVALSWIALQQSDTDTARKRLAEVPAHDGPEAVVSASLLELAEARLARVDGDIGRAIELTRDVRTKVATSAPWVAGLAVEEEVASVLSAGAASVAEDLVTTLAERSDTRSRLTAARLGLRQRGAGVDDCVQVIAGRSSEPLVARVNAGLVVAEAELLRGESKAARASVQRASRLAAPEGLRWPFHDAPPAVLKLIARDRTTSGGGSQRVTADGTSGSSARAIPRPRGRDGFPLPDDDSPAPLIDALTVKELEVLNHLSELLTTEEIAATMFVSVNTVRTHVRSILRKLSVSRRHQAVRRARALDILSSS